MHTMWRIYQNGTQIGELCVIKSLDSGEQCVLYRDSV